MDGSRHYFKAIKYFFTTSLQCLCRSWPGSLKWETVRRLISRAQTNTSDEGLQKVFEVRVCRTVARREINLRYATFSESIEQKSEATKRQMFVEVKLCSDFRRGRCLVETDSWLFNKYSTIINIIDALINIHRWIYITVFMTFVWCKTTLALKMY